MTKSRFTEEQMVTILREADRTSVAEAAEKNEVSEQTIYVWRKHFGAMEPTDVKTLRALESENAQLKKLLAERDLDSEALKEINRRVVGAQDRREQVAFACERGLSRRRACGLADMARSTLNYELRPADFNSPSPRPPASPRLLDALREAIRVRHHSIGTEPDFVDWARRLILFHGKRHPRDLGAAEVDGFLTHLAVDHSVVSSTQNLTKSALLFVHRVVRGPFDRMQRGSRRASTARGPCA